MKRPRILLINPWIHDFAAYDLWARPMGLLVLGTRLRAAGADLVLVDCLDPSHPEMSPVKVRSQAHGRFARTQIAKPVQLREIPRTYSRYGVHPELIRKDLLSLEKPAAILVTGMMTYWYPGVQETVSVVREVFPDVPVLLGGVYASLLPTHAREHMAVDEVVTGPGEAALAESLFRHTGLDLSPPEDAPSLEFAPALDLMRQVRFLPLLTSRGCPLRCAYCASSKIVPRFVRRSTAEVIEEIEQAYRHYGIQDIALYDDAFLVDAPRHALPILDAAAERFPGMRWHTPNGMHAAEIDKRVARTLKRAGFETIRLGMESSSDSFHARTGNKVDFRKFLTAVQNLREAGFARDHIGAYLLVGLPGQSRQQIEDDAERCLAAGAYPKLAEYSPIPGTAMWASALEKSRYPIEREPLFHNCSLLSAAAPEVDWQFLQKLRTRIREATQSDRTQSSESVEFGM